jgi:hypothetical protein
MENVYLLNSPFTFQAMEKHAAYCAMIRLGLKVPETVPVPYKNPPYHAKYAYTARRYNVPFDLDAVAAQIGYPMYSCISRPPSRATTYSPGRCPSAPRPW